jgi:hypothetical protein
VGTSLQDKDNKVRVEQTSTSYNALSYEVVSVPKPPKIGDGIFLSTDHNSMGYRSDEFVELDKSNNNVLFAGCSVTYGSGLFLKETWAHLVWSQMNNTSGFFNLSSVARSIPIICFEVIKYCNQYGNPNTLVLMLPDINRLTKYSYPDKEYMIHMFGQTDSIYAESSEYKDLEQQAFQYYTMLEIFCLKNNIDLFTFSWAQGTENLLARNSAKNLHIIDREQLSKKILKYKSSLPKDLSDYAMNARDRDGGKPGHPGIAIHAAWSEVILNDIKEYK